MKFLKTAKQSFGEVPPLSLLLHNHLRANDPARSLKVLHASELTKEAGYCPRRSALITKLLVKQKSRTLSTSEQVTFQIGRDLQDNVAHWFADMDRAYGNWRCVKCDHLSEFVMRPKSCTHDGCGSTTFVHEEMRFRSKISGASCGVDLQVKLVGRSKLVPVELKTIDKDMFKKLQMPLSEHRLRTNLYLRLIAESGTEASKFIDTSQAVILYVSKGGYGCSQEWLKKSIVPESFSPFKEFTIDRDDSATEVVSGLAKEFTDFLGGGAYPKQVCGTSTCPMARECEVRKACWSGKYKGDQ